MQTRNNIYAPNVPNLEGMYDQRGLAIVDNFVSSTNNEWFKVDLNSTTDTSVTSINTVTTATFGSGVLTLAVGGTPEAKFLRTAYRNRNTSVKNCMMTSTSNNIHVPIHMYGWIDGDNTQALAYIDPSNGLILHARAGNTDVVIGNNLGVAKGSAGGKGDAILFSGYTSSVQYTMTTKRFDNTVCALLTTGGRCVAHIGCVDGIVNSASIGDATNMPTVSGQYRNALGFLGDTANTSQQFRGFTSKPMTSFLNVFCLGDSNTEGSSGENDLSQGLAFTQLLNYKYRDKNVFFHNYGVSGKQTSDFVTWVPAYIQGTLRGASSCRNIAMVLLGTNDAGAVVNINTAISNYKTIITGLKQAGAEVWVLTYPPRSDFTGGTLLAANQFIMKLNQEIQNSGLADRVIDLWTAFVDPASSPVDNGALSTLLGTDKLHFNAAGHALIASKISQALDEVVVDAATHRLTKTNAMYLSGNNHNSTVIPSPNKAFGNFNLYSNGDIVLANSTTPPLIIWPNNNSYAAPAFTTRSLGARLVIFDNITSTQVDYAIGLDANTLWYSVPQGAIHNFYTQPNSTTIFSALQIGNNLISNVPLTVASGQLTQLQGGCTVTGAFSGGIGSPSAPTMLGVTNVSTVTLSNQRIQTNGTQNTYAATFACTPTAGAALTSFTITLPNRTNTATNAYDIVGSVQGFRNTSPPIAVSNCVGTAGTGGALTYLIQFTSIDTSVHFMQIILQYLTN